MLRARPARNRRRGDRRNDRLVARTDGPCQRVATTLNEHRAGARSSRETVDSTAARLARRGPIRIRVAREAVARLRVVGLRQVGARTARSCSVPGWPRQPKPMHATDGRVTQGQGRRPRWRGLRARVLRDAAVDDVGAWFDASPTLASAGRSRRGGTHQRGGSALVLVRWGSARSAGRHARISRSSGGDAAVGIRARVCGIS